MNILGLFGGEAVQKLSDTSKRSSHEPHLMLKHDRIIVMSAAAVSAVVLALAIFLGEEMYHVDGLTVYDSAPYGSHTDFIVKYCWAHLTHKTEEETISLYHYAYFPYILFIFSTIFYVIKITWRSSGLDELAHVLDYILDGLEEQMKDIIVLLKKHTLDELKSSNFGQRVRGNVAIISPEPINNNSLTQRGSKDALLLVDETKEGNAKEQNLRSKLQKKQKTPAYCRKYEYFHRLLKQHARTKKYINVIIIRRISIYISLIAVMGYIYYQFLMESRNPSIINCVLPAHLGQNETITLLFSPVTTRTSLMWTGLVAYFLIFLSANWYWIGSVSKRKPGMVLLDTILADKINSDIQDYRKPNDLNPLHFSDLDLLMELVYVNRNRLTYIELAFNMLYAAETKNDPKSDGMDPKKDSQSEYVNFLSILQESLHWQIDGSSYDEEIGKLVSGIIDNID